MIPARAYARHIGVFGATGTGKTTSAIAVLDAAPCAVLALDAKGDLERAGDTCSLPAMRVDALGPDLMARALDLSEAQAGALHIAMAWAEDTGRRVATLADLRALLNAVTARDMRDYGLVSAMSVAAVQRAMLRLERAAPWAFQPDAPDWRDTRGLHVVSCRHIAEVPGLYGAFAAHVLDSLYRGLNEIGDVTPGLVVMMDESHLMFQDAPAPIVRRIEQVTRLIRSRGVGLIYVTQSPADLPDAVAAQLGTRIQHALRATTPRQQAALRAAAETMPGRVTADQVAQLGTGQAIVSVLGAAGRAVQVTPCSRPTGSLDLRPCAPPPARHTTPESPPVRRRPSFMRMLLICTLVLWAMVAVSL